jgi:spermidine/putrescine transport system substrate-binding protein
MKRILSLVMAALMVSSLLSGCGSKGVSTLDKKKYPNGEVTVLNWGEYISNGEDGSINTCKEFEKQYGIKVNYKTCSDNETLYSILSGGGSDYDVIIIPSDYMISRLIQEKKAGEAGFQEHPQCQGSGQRVCQADLRSRPASIPSPTCGVRWASSTTPKW